MTDAPLLREKAQRRPPVPAAADRLRDLIFAAESGARLGGLQDLARALGVGIVTIQQAARVLEHEGLLEVRRGPGGGYYGRRPDPASLERSLAAYLRSEPASLEEVYEITSLLFNELCAAAAACPDAAEHGALGRLAAEIAACTDQAGIGALETALQEQLFRMVRRPLFEMLTRVALQHAATAGKNATRHGFGLDAWQESRRHILAAILARDPQLAQFEANRRNRQQVLALHRTEGKQGEFG